jgi:hypothetical protein
MLSIYRIPSSSRSIGGTAIFARIVKAVMQSAGPFVRQAPGRDLLVQRPPFLFSPGPLAAHDEV